MKYCLDTHTHTLASGHAYNSIREMGRAAQEKGLKLLGITEHAPRMPGTCHDFYFHNLKVVERELFGVELLLGAELNILDHFGRVDLDDFTLKQMDITIASLHPPCIAPGTAEENTCAVVNAMKNPLINIIGHPDDQRFPLCYEAVVEAAAENKVLLEVNNSSMIPGGPRKDARKQYITMLELCKQYKVPVVVGSDAHVDTSVGRHDYAYQLLEELDFPEHLVVNTSVEMLKMYVNKYKDQEKNSLL